MVVLEAGSQVVTVGNTQYLQPDYMSPVPSAVGFIQYFFLLFSEKKIISEN